MTKRLIMVTGEYRFLRPFFEDYVQSSKEYIFFPSLEDKFRDGNELGSVQFAHESYGYLAQKEIERDEILIKQLERDVYPIIEQWHVGNLARVRVKSPAVAKSYEELIIAQLKLFGNVKLYVFHASAEIEKYASEMDVTIKSSEYSELANIINRFGIDEYPIDVEAPPQKIKERLSFLFKKLCR